MMVPYVTRLSSVIRMTSHPDYRAAKGGSLECARRLVADILPSPFKFSRIQGFVCPVMKPTGNRIPLALAEYFALHSGLVLCTTVTLKARSHDSVMIDRLHYTPEFSGKVCPGRYVIVDDVYTSGSTLIALKRHIENGGGEVTRAFTIGSSRSTAFEPSHLARKILLARFPDAGRYFDLDHLTMPQVRYMLRFSSLGAIFKRYGEHVAWQCRCR